MKRVLLFSALFLAGAIAANAQDVNRPQTSANVGMTPIQKGNWMIGGSVGNIGYSFENKSFEINLRPNAGYFVTDGLAIGLQPSVSLVAIKDHDNVWNYGVEPFVRYFFPQGSSATGRFFAHGSVGIAGSSQGDGATVAAGANLGYAHFITQNVALEASAGYNYRKATISGSEKASGLGVALGFQIYLPGQR
ncbi:hypothetical protein GCM10011386_42790 [Parapedobacter defluvii]|uniref:Outer membrane protein beta-barrel domain-containing protein n=1 Tax=Parapedobacter defluvii TaxID=2045106 RepID=A0ABQ1MZF2_9SPHI|nr:hypothetical protein [Parapedobacter defluvii]GGC45956.1 hypothetical protein GCM10011386_42790 [Parapedobacter defluvii]